MKTKALFVVIFAFAGLYVMRCTSAVAPKQEGTAETTVDKNSGTSTGTKTATSSATGSDSSSDSGSGTGSSTATEETEATALGEITAVEGTLTTSFVAKSVYGSYSSAGGAKSLIISLTTSKLTEDSLKEVASYECKACSGTDDKHCVKDTSTADSISIIFSGTADTSKKVDADAFPKEDVINKTGLSDDSSTTISLQSAAAEFNNTGVITFASGGRPATATDDFEADLDLTMQSGKTYKAHIKSKIITFPTGPTAPTCGADEYLEPTYK